MSDHLELFRISHGFHEGSLSVGYFDFSFFDLILDPSDFGASSTSVLDI